MGERHFGYRQKSIGLCHGLRGISTKRKAIERLAMLACELYGNALRLTPSFTIPRSYLEAGIDITLDLLRNRQYASADIADISKTPYRCLEISRCRTPAHRHLAARIRGRNRTDIDLRESHDRNL